MVRRFSAGLLVLDIAACGYLYWRVTRFDSLILTASGQYQLDFHLVKSLIHEESWYNPSARGPDGEMGLMQVTPGVEREFMTGQARAGRPWLQLQEPADNLQVGCWYLRQSLDRFKSFHDPVPLALARYNAGESRVKVWIRNAQSGRSDPGELEETQFLNAIDIPSTRDYVARILKRYRTRKVFPL